MARILEELPRSDPGRTVRPGALLRVLGARIRRGRAGGEQLQQGPSWGPLRGPGEILGRWLQNKKSAIVQLLLHNGAGRWGAGRAKLSGVGRGPAFPERNS